MSESSYTTEETVYDNWELVRLKSKSELESLQDEDKKFLLGSDYVWLHTTKVNFTYIETNFLSQVELRVSMIPLKLERDTYVKTEPSQRRGHETWIAFVYFNSINGWVDFNGQAGNMMIVEELRGRGLGSYVLGKLVQWVVDNFDASFPVKSHRGNIEGSSENRERVNRMYGKFNLPDASTVGELEIPSVVTNRVERVTPNNFLEVLAQYNNLKLEVNNSEGVIIELEGELEKEKEGRERYQNQRYWLVGISIIAFLLGLLF